MAISEEQYLHQLKIKAKVSASNTTQAELSRKIGVGMGSVNQWLNGTYPMPDHIEKAIIEALEEEK